MRTIKDTPCDKCDYPDRSIGSEWCDSWSDEPVHLCWHCGGEGFGIVGVDWDQDDPINNDPPMDASDTCPCCRGSGLAKDCTFW